MRPLGPQIALRHDHIFDKLYQQFKGVATVVRREKFSRKRSLGMPIVQGPESFFD
jgi:hypothetical protein